MTITKTNTDTNTNTAFPRRRRSDINPTNHHNHSSRRQSSYGESSHSNHGADDDTTIIINTMSNERGTNEKDVDDDDDDVDAIELGVVDNEVNTNNVNLRRRSTITINTMSNERGTNENDVDDDDDVDVIELGVENEVNTNYVNLRRRSTISDVDAIELGVDNEVNTNYVCTSGMPKSCSWKKLILGLLLLGFIIFVIVDSLTNKYYARDTLLQFSEWIKENPTLGVVAFIVVYYFICTICFIRPGSIFTLGAGFVFSATSTRQSLWTGVLLGTIAVLFTVIVLLLLLFLSEIFN